MKLNLFLLLTITLLFYNANAQTQALINGNTKFTTDVYKSLISTEKGNFLVSPFSAQVVLALASEGCIGESFDQLTKGVGIPTNSNIRHQAYQQLLQSFNQDSELLKLLSANKIYVQNNFTIKQAFQNIARQVYYSDIKNINFAENVNAAEVINQWVEEHTNNKIQNLISSDSLSALTRVVLINALYFLGNWTQKFEVKKTAIGDFTTISGSNVSVSFMTNDGNYNYKETKIAQFIELPYQHDGNQSVSMIIVLPKQGKSGCMNVQSIFRRPTFTQNRVRVILPKFSIQTSIEFTPILQSLGVTDIFNKETADLSGMAGNKGQLIVSKVVQKTFINVTESGTEAAAATGVIVGTTSVQLPPPITFDASRPFMYYIQYNSIILFSGRVSDPSK
ncbi:unnamed protein product [Brassicogethes aeneus]|uniref:Serpin domain-containing protein n=1 Tax=Brassicogethes aeneus TaxID=1431903 RepID=A0A9P0F985_BRAAE|nr:unnamed protein product [Brassicogethes aeneus]